MTGLPRAIALGNAEAKALVPVQRDVSVGTREEIDQVGMGEIVLDSRPLTDATAGFSHPAISG